MMSSVIRTAGAAKNGHLGRIEFYKKKITIARDTAAWCGPGKADDLNMIDSGHNIEKLLCLHVTQAFGHLSVAIDNLT